MPASEAIFASRYQAANMTQQELREIQSNLEQGRASADHGRRAASDHPDPAGAARAVEKAEQSQKLPNAPLEARILVVAEVYDSMTSARDARISSSEAMERITQRTGIEYDAEQ